MNSTLKTRTKGQTLVSRHLIALILIPLSLLVLQGCILGTVVEVAAETVEAGVELTGAVVGTAVDIVVPDGDDAD